MKHGHAFRKLSRTASHRMLMLRNLVTSLFEHERIKTTLPKAKEAARLAEKVITLGKKGSVRHMQQAGGFLLKPEMVPKLFNVFAARYAERPGGYTRIHKYGSRRGDNAPHAILELVDNPHDLKFEMAARTVGFELYGRLARKLPQPINVQDATAVAQLAEAQQDFEPSTARESPSPLRDLTRLNIKKALRYRSKADIAQFGTKARDHVERLMAMPKTKPIIEQAPEPEKITYASLEKMRREDKTLYQAAGQRLPKHDPTAYSAVSLSRGATWQPSIFDGRRRRKLGISSEGQRPASDGSSRRANA